MITIIGCILTVGLSVMFGLMGKPKEMALTILVCSIALCFINIDKINKFKAGSFEAEMKATVDEANATIKQLREVASTFAEATLTNLMASTFVGGMTMKQRLLLHDQLIVNLKDIGASDKQIARADKMWEHGIGVIFNRMIENAIEGRDNPNIVNIKDRDKALNASREFHKLLKFDEWKAPTSAQAREFIVDKGVMNTQVDELLKDYQEFENTGGFRRIEVFVNDKAYGSVGIPLTYGAIQVKENYNKDKKLMAITVMYKVKGYNSTAGDWFWVKFTPDGTAKPYGKPKGCVSCHGAVADNDFVMVHEIE